jgi:hypothetical protein
MLLFDTCSERVNFHSGPHVACRPAHFLVQPPVPSRVCTCNLSRSFQTACDVLEELTPSLRVALSFLNDTACASVNLISVAHFFLFAAPRFLQSLNRLQPPSLVSLALHAHLQAMQRRPYR